MENLCLANRSLTGHGQRVWRGLEQSLIDDAVDQWHACMLVFVSVVAILNIPCDCQFVFSVLDEPYVSHDA